MECDRGNWRVFRPDLQDFQNEKEKTRKLQIFSTEPRRSRDRLSETARRVSATNRLTESTEFAPNHRVCVLSGKMERID